MAYKSIVKAIPMVAQASTAFTGSYILVTTLPNACFLLRIVNNSDEDVAVSYDGTTDHDLIPKGTSENINAQTNASPQNQQCLFAAGTPIYIKGVTGMAGSVNIVGYYQPIGDY